MTIEVFFTWVATPFLLIITGLFVYLVRRAGTLVEEHRDHALEVTDQFNYSHKTMLDIGKNVQKLDSSIKNTIVPHITSVYQQIGALGVEASVANIIDMLAEEGWKAMQLTKDGVVFLGTTITSADLKLTHLIQYKSGASNLSVKSFAYCISELPPELLEGMLRINEDNMIGSIGLRHYEDKYIVMVDHAAHIPSGRIARPLLMHILGCIGGVQVAVGALLDKLSAKRNEIQLNDYLKLELGPAQFAKLQKSLDVGEKEEQKAIATPDNQTDAPNKTMDSDKE